ncbi:methylated-DNA--[protein]-cysteine S-methyltransferase [Gordonia sp. (in: high G+C Gram-positive bacteria)]|uniref:methylated-DNA--[protein]-cysteine S-methyltransferase n=1 Tax=Gordonia sp. (in: high G+C Gram-positive bacteria) TaxID=84139 RepID=UPI00169C8CEA|nr:methylated-DNA--[protein]-cysteine S-methyltransferase [Gordonia sp. (in: high G+C Gram-positive bacteria)]NLG48241.1 methylated-DNA--[protein]-cysteine S-methyltransferase [Gordonia sp. (in: high G+C Gram-positive bacteria)]
MTAQPVPTDPTPADPVPGLGWTTVTTPDGPFTILVDDAETVFAAGWTESPDYLDALISTSLRIDGLHQRAPGSAADAVLAYYDGDFGAPSRIAVRQDAGPFIQESWAALRRVAPGHPVTYARLAELAGRPTAVRGAAQCCVRNAAALFVPCHRVTRSDGTLGGYRYGLALKALLLDREAIDLDVAV